MKPPMNNGLASKRTLVADLRLSCDTVSARMHWPMSLHGLCPFCRLCGYLQVAGATTVVEKTNPSRENWHADMTCYHWISDLHQCWSSFLMSNRAGSAFIVCDSVPGTCFTPFPTVSWDVQQKTRKMSLSQGMQKTKRRRSEAPPMQQTPPTPPQPNPRHQR